MRKQGNIFFFLILNVMLITPSLKEQNLKKKDKHTVRDFELFFKMFCLTR